MKKTVYLILLCFVSLLLFRDTPVIFLTGTGFGKTDPLFSQRVDELKQSASFHAFCDLLFTGVVDYCIDEMDGLGDLTVYGAEKYQHRLRPLTREWENQYVAWIEASLETISGFTAENDTKDYYLKESLTRYLQNEKEKYTFRHHIAQLSPVIGSQIELRQLFLVYHPLRNRQDALDFIARLKMVPEKVDQILARFEESNTKGMTMNVHSLAASQWLMNELIQTGSQSAIAVRFSEEIEKMKDVEASEKTSLISETTEVLNRIAVPAFKKVIAALRTAQNKPNRNLGASSQPEGDAWYRYALKYHTTQDIDPAELHQWGLQEVEKLRDEIYELRKTGYSSRLTPIGGSVWDYLGEWFRPEFIPDYQPEIVPFYATMYSSPNLEQSSKGIYYSAEMPVIENTVYFHEVVPGHHLERINQLNRDLPLAAQLPFFTAYIEGWALYSESLVAERFPYPDRLMDCKKWQLIRAKRVVADTGINALGWTYDQTVAYMSADDSMDRVSAQNEVNRYLTWPGQACAYYVGYKKILELRERAKTALKDDFDIKEFHKAVLEYGQLPLDLLETKIERWINTTLP
jgi:uncharacterized protein (DUF885 family)